MSATQKQEVLLQKSNAYSLLKRDYHKSELRRKLKKKKTHTKQTDE